MSRLHARLDEAVSQVQQHLHSKLSSKAEVSQLTATNSNLAARLDSSEQRLMQGLKLLADTTTAALQLKADDSAVRASSRRFADEMCHIRALLAAACTRLAEQHSSPSQPRTGSELASFNYTSPPAGKDARTSTDRLTDELTGVGEQQAGGAGGAGGAGISASEDVQVAGPVEVLEVVELMAAAGKEKPRDTRQQPEQRPSAAGVLAGTRDEAGPVVLSPKRPHALLIVGHQQLLAPGLVNAASIVSAITGAPTSHTEGPAAAADHCHSKGSSRAHQQSHAAPQAKAEQLGEPEFISSHHNRPQSTLRPWSNVGSPSPASLRKSGHGGVRSAAQSAKLMKAKQDRHNVQQEVLQAASSLTSGLQRRQHH